MPKKKIAILGATGSIGTQALDVVSQHPDLFEARVLTAGRRADLLIDQARRFLPDAVVIADESQYQYVQEALADLPVKVYAGEEALCQVVEGEQIDIVLTALVGFAGLKPTLHAINARKAIAVANEETLVVAGELVMQRALARQAPILPVDSEHSAIFQCLAGERSPIEKIILTASGGPFRLMERERLAAVTPTEALKHPNWQMGAKITIDSATMMNKGFEMIEAKWLFGVSPTDIEIVVHPESIIHSAVQFADGAVKAQLGMPDMRVPIQYALSYPQRLTLNTPKLDLFTLGHLTFEKPDMERFACLALAYEATQSGGNKPCVLNAANEMANLAFREGRLGFLQIAEVIAETMARTPFVAEPSLDTYLATDKEARAICADLIAGLS